MRFKKPQFVWIKQQILKIKSLYKKYKKDMIYILIIFSLISTLLVFNFTLYLK